MGIWGEVLLARPGRVSCLGHENKAGFHRFIYMVLLASPKQIRKTRTEPMSFLNIYVVPAFPKQNMTMDVCLSLVNSESVSLPLTLSLPLSCGSLRFVYHDGGLASETSFYH